MNTAFDSISIKIASPDQIKDSAKETSCKYRKPADATDGTFNCPEKGTCNCGEVKKAETINYRSFRPEPEGLFCEAIFGPQKDWECNCGKYKRIKHKGVICDRCGVEITQQRVRRDRLGYIQLAAPVSHIWYFKGLPSRIGLFCGLSTRDVERVLYFEGFIVVEVDDPEPQYQKSKVPGIDGSLVPSISGSIERYKVSDVPQFKEVEEYKILDDIPRDTADKYHFHSSSEKAIFDFLLKEGHEVVPQVAVDTPDFVTNYCLIDLAINTGKPGEYCLGIEFDGPFHDKPDQKERDLEQQKRLEERGWKIHRIHHTDWYDKRKATEQKLLKAIKDAKKDQSAPPMLGRSLSESEWKDFYEGKRYLNPELSESERQKVFYEEHPDLNPEETRKPRPQFAWRITEVNGEGGQVIFQILTESERTEIRNVFPDLKVEPIWRITEVFDSEIPLRVDQELSETEYQQAREKYPPKDEELTEAELKKRGSELRNEPVLRRITEISDALEDCDLLVNQELSEKEYQQALKKYQVRRIDHVDKDLKKCPLQVGAELSETEYQQALEQYQIEKEEEIPVDKPPVEVGQVLTEVEYVDLSNKYEGQFRAGTGAEVIREILSNIDLEEKIKELTQELEETTSQQKRLKTSKQLKQMSDFAAAEQRPEWMILDVIPVIPPDLRPLVPLEGGRFATSDLNDLYRRVINRNNRLRKLIQLRSPEVILRNEKRMLQEAVDAFFDNGRHGRRVTGPGNRPLKSLAEVLKGKIGRFRQNLLGKRVDYSGRSVIVVGPELGLHQCGIPKQMAVELFKPFIIERLQAYGYTQTIKRAKHIAEHVDSDSPVWEVVEEVIADHPVLLNRPPTLHRLGIQAFLPVLVEGKSIRIPPLVCKAFNADFDGDQMAVHVPLTVEAQAEAKLLMLSSHNILKPSHGDPIAVPELDMVLGPSFLTKTLPEYAEDAALLHEAYTTSDTSLFDEIRQKPWYHRRYSHPEDVITAHVAGQLKLHDSIQLFCKSNGHTANGGATEPILTTVGRVIFNEVLPPELEWEDEHSQQVMPFYNAEAGGRELSALIHRCFNELGTGATVDVLENVQKLAFEYATLSGVSPGIKDYITPDNRDALVDAAKSKIASLLEAAETTDREEHENEQIRIWFDAMAQIEKKMFTDLPELEDTPLVERGDPRKVHPYVNPDGTEVADKTVKGFSPVHIMADSGARARKNPFMQISAFIGLKAKQDGNILIPPIGTSTDNEYFSSYREGLDVLDYFNSTYGSRKGLVDTALKTASSGYLTRRLVDVAQDVRITTADCGTLNSIQKFPTAGGDLTFKISGRTTAEDIRHPENGDVLVPANEVISAQMADRIDKLGIQTVNVRSVLTCQADDGVCAKCYGNDLTTNNLVNVGEAIGIIAAQSIGEPGTQLTMRTFHTGGAVEEVSEARQHRILSKAAGTVRFRDFQLTQTVKREGDLWIVLENRTNLDGPAYKVQQVNHPECQLREGELLSEKQYSENAERYKGFDTKAWQYEVTEVLDSNCKIKVGQQLSQAEYNRALVVYGFQRFVTPKYRVTEVQHLKISVAVGDLLTEEEVEQKKEEIRQGFDGQWHYSDSEVDAIFADGETTIATDIKDPEIEDDSATDQDVDFRSERVYRITEKTDKAFPYQVGEEVSTEDITPWLTPFEVELKPVYVVHTDVDDFSLEQVLTAREFEDARQKYQQLERAFKVEKHDIERHIVTTVHHPECPLTPGEEITKDALDRAHKRFSGFNVQKLKHRVTQVYHPDCTLKPGDLISESETKKYQERYQGFTTSTQEDTLGRFEAERMYRITAVNHEDCPLKVGEVITQQETTTKRRQYKGIEVSRHYEVTNVEDGTTTLTVGQTLTEAEYKALQKTDKTLREKVVSRYHVVSVHHPELQQELKVDTELSDKDYKTYNRKFKGFDTELIYRIVEDKRDIDTPLEPGTELLSKEYRALEKANKRITHTVTAVYHPNCQYAVNDELTDQEYNNAQVQFRGFEVDELDLQMRIEVETDEGTRVPHVIPADYSFSLAEGDTVRKGEALAELHERTANLDIVAGIPRVTDLFEARRLKRGDAAQIAEIEGYVRSAGTKNGIPTYRIEHEGYKSKLYQIPDEKLRIAEGDWVDAGEQLTDGFLNPHDILSIGRVTIEGIPIEGEEAVWAYLVDEVQRVYGKSIINDKHVEVIVRQMLTKVRITDPGDTHFYPNDEVHRKEFQRVNSEILEKDGAPATGEPILQSISKASLSTDSFISAASFQQTTKVLTDAAVSGQTDKLFGLKENVILGRLIPAGSGFSEFQNLEVAGEDDPDEVSDDEEQSESKKDEADTPETSTADIADALFLSDDE